MFSFVLVCGRQYFVNPDDVIARNVSSITEFFLEIDSFFSWFENDSEV